MKDTKTNAPSGATSGTDGSPKSFEMILSVIAAMEETRKVALEEMQEAQAAAPGNPFAPGVRAPQHLVESVNETLRSLKPEVHNLAKVNNWALPEGV